jgi:hypothetical protein
MTDRLDALDALDGAPRDLYESTWEATIEAQDRAISMRPCAHDWRGRWRPFGERAPARGARQGLECRPSLVLTGKHTAHRLARGLYAASPTAARYRRCARPDPARGARRTLAPMAKRVTDRRARLPDTSGAARDGQAAIALLRRWRAEPEEPGDVDAWQRVKDALDVGRADKRLFPDG